MARDHFLPADVFSSLSKLRSVTDSVVLFVESTIGILVMSVYKLYPVVLSML